ncbi:MAG: precorrin-4 C(11)-methyltransferase [Syntrophomonadaceae bacterium]|nr:precorrin-4 C(11)-methyltransferase [Syntrophomonadaceae bacterium]
MINFVGAGPGAPDLITLRGAELLKTADAIIYAGSLINPALLEYAGSGCELHNSAEMTLDQVMAVLLRVHRAGGMAVRLHTGDPSIYGAVREQMDRLKAEGVPYEICPGVSSFCGAAAALKTEYTLPQVSQSVIITRRAGRTPVPPGESISSFAAHGASMVIFLSTGLAEKVQGELLAGGYNADTPAAIVYKATWPDEKVFRCTVGTIAETAAQNGVSNMALILVGDFMGYDYQLSRLYDPAFTHAFRQGSEG